MSAGPSARSYNLPENSPHCDIVLKGGITSGVAYPKAVCKLAQHYRYSSIGGTSVGALSAALVAAAEFGRSRIDKKSNRGSGFADAYNIADELSDTDSSGRTKMFKMFQPQAGGASCYRLITKLLFDKPGSLRRIMYVLKLLSIHPLAGFFLALMCSINIVLGSGISISLEISPVLFVFVFFIGSLLSFVVWAALFAYKTARFLGEESYFGLCTGFAGARDDDTPSLVEWLHGKIQLYAGKTQDGPLTMGELWHCRAQDSQADSSHSELARSKRKIQLQLIATCISHSRPYTIPFEPDEHGTNRFFFKPSEMKRFFPDDVVNSMVNNSPDFKNGNKQEEEIMELPPADQLPVVFAARLSCSFPYLLCAVPLYAIDHYGTDKVKERCWFSDGGICSNFPVHFFDKPLPDKPTFCIDLLDLDAGLQLEEPWMPAKNDDGVHSRWRRFNDIFGFFHAVFNTGLNWFDNVQTTAPGFRDRIAHIVLDPKKEGGLHLNMDEDLLKRVADRGERAANLLVDRFINGKSPMNWLNHRWIRFTSAMMLFEKKLGLLLEEMDSGTAPSYYQLLCNPPQDSTRGDSMDLWKAVMTTVYITQAARDTGRLYMKEDYPVFTGAALEPRLKWHKIPRI